MSDRRPRAGLPLLLLAGCLLLSVIALVFLALSRLTPTPLGYAFRGAFVLWAVPLSSVGALIASRRPENPIGWLFSAGGLAAAGFAFLEEYQVYAVLTTAGRAPLGPQAAWVASWIWVPVMGLVTTYVFLVFPDGRLVSSRWRAAVWLTGVALLLAAVGIALDPGPLEAFPVVVNPYGVEAVPISVLAFAGVVLFALSLVVAGLSLVLRFGRARGRERQQLKWLTYAAVLACLAFGVQVAWVIVGGGVGAVPRLVEALVVLAVAALPVAVGIAVLRYRLYDIDRIINRTVVYAILTFLLGLVYAGGVFLLGPVVSSVRGDSDFAVALSTLAVAALFQPARRRVQSTVDRRFNRRRYDVARTLGAFNARLRQEIDLDTLSHELLGVVTQTMQPAQRSLWLRQPGRDHA